MAFRKRKQHEIKIINSTEKSKKFIKWKEIAPPKSLRFYKYHIFEYCIELKITDLDEYIKDPRKMNKNKRIEYEDKIKHDIRKYWNQINQNEDKFRGKTPYVFLSAIKSIIEEYGITYPPSFWKTMRNNGNGNYALTDKYVPTQEELKQILNWGDTEDKALFLCLLATGQRIDRFLKEFKWSKYEKVKHEEYPYFYFSSKQKGKKPVKTFITPEAKQCLEEYRKQYNKIVYTREARTPKVKRKELDRDLIFPMSYRVANEKWNKMTKKAGFYELDENSGKPRTGIHILRSYLLSNFGNQNDALYFMGKTPENIGTYRDAKIETLREKYIKGSKNITVYTTPKDTLIKLNKTQEDIEKIKEDKKKYKDELKLLKERNNYLNDRIKELSETLIFNNAMIPLADGVISRITDKGEEKITPETKRKLLYALVEQNRKIIIELAKL